MNAPDKIYLTSTPYRILNGWCDSKTPLSEGMEQVEYIRKDALLEWAEQEKSKTSIGLSEYDAGHENARMELLNDLIDKINTL